jgi:hypothetical protein
MLTGSSGRRVFVMPRAGQTLAVKQRNPDAFDDALANAQMAEVQRLSAAHTEDAVRSLVEIATATERELFTNEDGYFPVVMLEEEDENGQITEVPSRKPYLPGPRVTAAKALLEHAHGRPTQRVQQGGGSGEARITVVLHTFGSNGEQVEIDITPTPERITGGADPPT